MKFFIWCSCLFVVAIIGVFINDLLDAAGMMLGALGAALFAMAEFSAVWCSANWLCARWDVKVFEKKANKQGKTPGEYAWIVFPPSLLELCAANKNDKAAFKKILKQNVAGEVITKSDANVLLYMFNVASWY